MRSERLIVWDEIVGEDYSPDLHISLSVPWPATLPIEEIISKLPEELQLIRMESDTHCKVTPAVPSIMSRNDLYTAFIEFYREDYVHRWELRHDFA
ncbi:MAG: hypothetical protein PVI21_04240 [Candidatus Woesebacteria bacterium]|jgi:hypothetical protein